MDIPGLSTNGLKAMQAGIKKALAVDDATPADQQKLYGVRQFPDWRIVGDAMEAELTKRQEKFTPIPW
jgi:hypothetical protein